MNTRGATLVELVVALTLAAAVSGMVLALVAGQQRAVQRLAVAEASGAVLSATAGVVRVELGGLAGADLLLVASDRLQYRATRATGVLCGLAPDGVRVGAGGFRGLRLPSPGRDSLLVARPDSPGWGVVVLAVVGPVRAEPCPDGSAGLVIPTSPGLPALPAPVPFRVVEPMELRFYSSGGRTWLGARALIPAETIQPVTGPFLAARFEAEDSTGAATTDPGRVVVLRTRVRIQGDDAMAAGGVARSGVRDDSLVVVVPVGRGGG